MLKVGITGGIGSGKTTVCEIFALLGVPVYYADERAKSIMVENQSLIKAIKKNFGETSYFKDGSLNRKHLSSIIFKDNKKLALLNSLVHPAVFRDAEQWQNAQKGVPYTLKEAALTFESGSYKVMDKMITVYAPEDIRIRRVIARDSTTEEEVRARMDKQMPEIEKINLSDFVIINDGKHSLINQVIHIHKELIQEDAEK